MPGVTPDLVLLGGRVWTGDPGRRVAEAIALHGDRIVAVGCGDEVRDLAGPRTRVVDVRGRSILPGFQDAHIHVASSGVEATRCDLRDGHDPAGYARIVAAYATAHPEREWVLGGGWSLDDFPGGTPRREDLDRVLPDRPAFLPNRDGHGAWVNSVALARAGVTAATPDPADGRIERDADGSPSGTLHEGAMALVERLVPADTQEEIEAAIVATQPLLHALGITAWQEATVDPVEQAAWEAVDGRGQLSARVVGAMTWDHDRGLEQIDDLVARRDRARMAGVRRFQPTSVKIFLDGIVENFTASMLEPYLDADGHATENRGLRLVDPGHLAEIVTRLDALGFQPHFHAIGDRAVRDALDAVEAARRANGPSDTRPHVAHIQVIHPADIPRFVALGVAPNAQPYWAVHERQMDVLTIPFIGPERAAWQYPFASLLRAGARLAMGSDWSVSTPNPLLEIEVATTRVSDLSRDGAPPFLPGERLSLEDAVRAFTAGSARVNHLDETGTLEADRLADLVVLDRDLFAPDAGPVGETRVLATFVGGVAVHEDPAFDR